MKRRILAATAACVTVLCAGCIVLDEVTTVSIRPDGSSHLVVFDSNVRSTEQGAEAEKELKRYVEQFNAQSSEDFVRIRNAGGEVVGTNWVRDEPPYSTLVTARFHDAQALEKLWTIEGKEDDLRLSTRFSKDGTRRKLSMIALPPKDLKLEDISPDSREARQNRANGISELRIVVIDGRILASQGWTVASDNRSALLSLEDVAQLIRKNSAQVELFLEWEVLATARSIR